MMRKTPPNETEIREELRLGNIQLPPFRLMVESAISRAKDNYWDGCVRLNWRQESYSFAVKCRRLLTPRVLDEAIYWIQQYAIKAGESPLLVTPYLGPNALKRLEQVEISGMDLCGNGIVIVPGSWLVVRSGNENRFRSEAVIKNIYKKNSSIAPRLFLARSRFRSLQDAYQEIMRRGGQISLSTLSKACKALEDDLVITRRGKAPGVYTSLENVKFADNVVIKKVVIERPKREGCLKLIQPEKLLDLLVENYSPPATFEIAAGKYLGTPEELRERIDAWEQRTGGRATLTGASSATAYAVMAREATQSYYCTNAVSLLRDLGDRFQKTDRFPTLKFIETQDPLVHFDRRSENVAAPVQAFLELSTGDKRDQETAVQVHRFILAELSKT